MNLNPTVDVRRRAASEWIKPSRSRGHVRVQVQVQVQVKVKVNVNVNVNVESPLTSPGT
ncbi:MAG: hypothetical protein ABI678_14750 [Kofleriaceae bacterium]